MLQALIGAIFGVGLFLIFADCFRVPFFRTSKAINNVAKRQEKKTSTLDIWLGDLAMWISKKLRLNEFKRMQLEIDLRSAGVNMSPEMHIANSLVKSMLIGVMAIPMLFIFPLLTPIIVALAVMMYFKASKGVADKIKEKRRRIEYELPRFVSHIEKTLKHNRDVLYILDSYQKNAGDELKHEIGITVADMRSGNYEAALTRFESRVGSSMLSDVTRGLIGVLRGDETEVYWSGLAVKFSDYQRQNLKQQAQKVPGKVKRLSMCLLFCFMLIYIVVIGMEIVNSIGILFG
jgi:Flp pilus assembly protein TadB